MDWALIIAAIGLAVSVLGSTLVLGRSAGKLTSEVQGLRRDVKGITAWLTKVEQSGSKTAGELGDLRVSVARVEGKLDAETRERRESDRSLVSVQRD